jgi:hypothetical protein
MEPGSLVLDETATTLTERKAQSSECGLAVVRDIYYLKLLAIEVVSQLALDIVDQEPPEMTGHVGEGGWIEMEVTAPQLVDNKKKTVQVELQVSDANGHMGKQSTKVTVKPSP